MQNQKIIFTFLKILITSVIIPFFTSLLTVYIFFKKVIEKSISEAMSIERMMNKSKEIVKGEEIFDTLLKNIDRGEKIKR